MQFGRNGPDIPERLLQAHEDGHVVFFCGAGISYRAGLPGFKGLTEQIVYGGLDDGEPWVISPMGATDPLAEAESPSTVPNHSSILGD